MGKKPSRPSLACLGWPAWTGQWTGAAGNAFDVPAIGPPLEKMTNGI